MCSSWFHFGRNASNARRSNLTERRRDLTKLVLSFKYGVKVRKDEFREASKAKLLEVGLELKVLRAENSEHNMKHWRVIVDTEGVVIARRIREAVRRGLVTEVECHE